MNALERRSIPLRPTTWDESDRSFEAVVSTGAPVMRRDAKGGYEERLSFASIDLTALSGIPVLDNHRQVSARDVIGKVRAARLEGGALIATIVLGGADDITPLAQRARDGHVFLSLGYFEGSRAESVEAGRRVRTVVPKIFEMSFAAVPAERQTGIRSQPMEETIEAVEMPEADAARIRSLGELADLPPSFAQGQIEAGATIEEARTAARQAMQERTRSAGRIRVVSPPSEDPAIRLRSMGEALDARVGGTAPSEGARQYIGASFRDLATECLHIRGVSTRGMNADAVFRAAHTTSDFPQLLLGTGNRTLLASYQAAASPLKQLARQGSRPDFRTGSTVKLGELSALSKTSESGEIKALSRSEAAESYALETYAGIFSLTRKALINDDLHAFADWARAAGQAAATTEANTLWGLLAQANGAGPIMGEDNKRLFSADHGNILTGAALDVNSLSEARYSLRTSKGLDGKTALGVTPTYLLVGPESETVGEQVLAAITANTVAEVNPFAGKLTLLVEPRITDDVWYLFGNPATTPVLEFSYLASAPGPQMAQREGWDVLTTEYRVVLDFGAGAIDWRGAVKNPGA